MNFDLVTSIIFYALRFDLTELKFNSIEAAINDNPYLIIEIKSGHWYNREYVNSISEISFLDGLGQPIFEVSDGQWKLKKLLVETDFFVSKIHLRGVIVDPEGLMTERLSFGSGIQGVKTAIIRLREMAKFESIANYQLFVENNRLKKENEQLKTSNTALSLQLSNPEK